MILQQKQHQMMPMQKHCMKELVACNFCCWFDDYIVVAVVVAVVVMVLLLLRLCCRFAWVESAMKILSVHKQCMKRTSGM